jgi:uncharacterized membrane protein
MNITDKNVLALHESLKALESKVGAQAAEIDGLRATVRSLQERLALAEQGLNYVRAAQFGRGSTQ